MTTETRPAGYHRAALVNALDGGMCDDCDSTCPRCEKARTLVDRHAAEVRAAAFDQAADAVRSGAIQFDSEAAAHALTNGGGIALIAYVQTTIADALSHRAAAARPDNTTGA